MMLSMEGRRAFSVPVQLDEYHLASKLSVLHAVLARGLVAPRSAAPNEHRASRTADIEWEPDGRSEPASRGTPARSLRVPLTPSSNSSYSRTASCPHFETQLVRAAQCSPDRRADRHACRARARAR